MIRVHQMILIKVNNFVEIKILHFLMNYSVFRCKFYFIIFNKTVVLTGELLVRKKCNFVKSEMKLRVVVCKDWTELI